jgi:hypothetical protein
MRQRKGDDEREPHSAHAAKDPHGATPGVPLRQNVMILLVIQRKSQFPRNGGAGTVGLVHPNGYLSRFAKMREGGIN